MRRPKQFYVYIMTNRLRSHVPYTGIKGDLSRRVFEHKNKLVPGFTSRYNLTRLAYYECFFDPDAAINREKGAKDGVGVRRLGSSSARILIGTTWRSDGAKNISRRCPGAAREIPRPACENAGLRDDASQQR
jgi:putative endonuclease